MQNSGYAIIFAVVASLSGLAQAAGPDTAVLEQRLKALEARVVELERRLEAKETSAVAPAAAVTPVAPAAPAPAIAAVPAVAPTPAAVEGEAVPAASPPSMAPAKWHALKRGMSWGQVVGLLGKPGKKRVGTMNEIWYYPDTDGGSVEFDRDGRVSGWIEP